MATLKIDTPRWALPMFEPARYKGVHGGRGSGKSHFVAEYIIESHIIDPNRSTVCIREIQRSLTQSVKRLLELKIESLGVSHYFEVQESMIKSKNGSGIIIFQGMQNHTADSIKSLEGFDCAWVEEAQSLSQRSLDLLRPTIRKEKSELIFTWNPSKSSDPVDFLLRGESPPPESKVIQVNYTDNPWFPDVLRGEMEYDKRRDPEKYTHVWLGSYLANSSARMFKNWRVEEFETPASAIFRFGADWGFAQDPTVLARAYVVGKTIYVDYEAYKIGCDIDFTPDLFASIPQSTKWPIVADSSRPETISYMQKHGFPNIVKAVKGAGSVKEGLAFLQSYDIVVHPRCIHTIDELTHCEYKVDKLTGLITSEPKDMDNHVIDALMYANEGARRISSAEKQTIITPSPIKNFW